MKSVSVISPAGRRGTAVVAACRLAYALGVGLVIVAAGHLIDAGFKFSAASVALLVVGTLLAGGGAFAEIMLGAHHARREEKRIRRDYLHTYLQAATVNVSPGRAVTELTDFTERLTEFRQVFLGGTFAALAIPFVALGYISLVIDPFVGLGVLVAIPLIVVLLRGFSTLTAGVSARSREQRARLSAKYLDALRKLVTVRMVGAGERVEKQLRDEGEKNRKAIMRLLAANQTIIIVLDGLLGLLIMASTALLTAWRLDGLTLGQAVTAVSLVVLLLEPVQQVAGFFYVGMGGLAAQKALKAFFGAHEAAARAPRPPADTALSLRDVAFSYDAEQPIFNGLDLDIPRGERLAIVGRSGGGKSTLLGLMSGKLQPDAGSITGEPEPALVAQSTWLFTGTVAENLRLAKPDATDAEMWDALRRAYLADEIADLQQDVGERGTLLSGGQAQRLSLARAFLSGRRLLLLDEPTSQIDHASEEQLIRALRDLDDTHTLVIVTHRRSLVPLADRVLTLADGRLATEGTAR